MLIASDQMALELIHLLLIGTEYLNTATGCRPVCLLPVVALKQHLATVVWVRLGRVGQFGWVPEVMPCPRAS